MTGPIVKEIDGPSLGRHRFRIEGGTLRADWQDALDKRPGPAWCEITVWEEDSGALSAHVGSYGGSVWPTAWPDLFQPIPGTVQYGSGGVRITDAGRALLVAALAEGEAADVAASSKGEV
jgi:hypothetical protein